MMMSLHKVAAMAVVLFAVGMIASAPNGALASAGPLEGELWVATYDGPASSVDQSEAVAVSPDGSKVFVTGWSQGTGSYDYATRAYDSSTGTLVWEQRFNGWGNGPDEPFSIAVSPDGSKVFVTGETTSAHHYNYFYATLAYDAVTGAQLWAVRYNGPGGGADVARAIGVSPDGARVFVTGGSKGDSTGRDYATVAYNTATGQPLWTRRYNGLGHGTDDATALAVSPDGSTVFVTGWSKGVFGHLDYATVAYDSVTGSRRWSQRYDGPAHLGDRALSVGASPDGSLVVVTGSSHGISSGEDYATVAYEAATGTVRWVRRYDGPAEADDIADSLVIAPDGSKVFVNGYSGGAVSRDWATLAYDLTTGRPVWLRRSRGPVWTYCIAVSPDGSKVFVTGIGGNSAVTVAYQAATGSLAWTRSYQGSDDLSDHSDAIVVSPDGSKVFLTGYRVSRSFDHDYLTVAYSA